MPAVKGQPRAAYDTVTTIVRLVPDVAVAFPNEEAVNG